MKHDQMLHRQFAIWQAPHHRSRARDGKMEAENGGEPARRGTANE